MKDSQTSIAKRSQVFGFAAQILSSGSVLRLRAHGWSMYPFIKHDDVLEVEPVEASALSLGDIVLCRRGAQEFVTHRVVKLSDKGSPGALETRGDLSSSVDPPVLPEQVLGRVVAIERGSKRMRLDTRAQRMIQALCARIPPRARWLYLPWARALRTVHRALDESFHPLRIGAGSGAAAPQKEDSS